MGGSFFSWVLSAGESACNNRHNTLYVREHIVVPEPEHAIAVRLQKFGSSCVRDYLPDLGVATAVNLDDEFASMAAKIYKIRTDRGLPAKMRVNKSRFAKMPPEFSLRRGHHAAKLTGKRHPPVLFATLRRAARHAPHP